MAIISANLQFNRGGHGLLDYSSLQKNYSTALSWAQDVNSNAAVGQFIYLEEAETIEEVTYAKGPYVVDAIGEKAVLTPLSKSVAGNPDLASIVSNLQGDVGTLTSNLAITDTSVKALETTVNAIPTTYATKSELETAIGNVDFSALATKEEVTEGLALKADASNVYTKSDVDTNFVAKDGYVAYTEAEKTKLSGIAEGAEVNYIKSVGANLNVDASGELTVTIPSVEVPFQSVATEDKVLKLENGVLSSTLSFGVDTEAREDGKKYLYVKGINDVEIGKVDTTDFIVDGMLNNVEPIDGSAGWYRFTFNVDKDGNNTNDTIDVDFSEFIDVYAADNTTIELKDIDGVKTFNVKANVFDAYGDASKALQDAKDYADTIGNVKIDSSVYSAKVAEIDASIGTIMSDLANKLEAGDVANFATKTELSEGLAEKADASQLSNKVDKVNGSSLVEDSLITKLNNIVEITEVGGDLALTEGVLSVDLSGKVDKVDGKGLSSNDFTDELKTKLEGIASGAEVNVVKSVTTSDELNLSNEGVLSLNLSSFAKTTDLSSKLDASAKVNGVSFVNGEVTIDAGDIALEVAITRTEGEEQKTIYEASSSIQSVLAGLSARIDTLDPNISGEFGVSSINAGSGIEVTGASSTPTIAVKVSNVEGNIVELKTDGVYVAAPEVPDMRSYWETI